MDFIKARSEKVEQNMIFDFFFFLSFGIFQQKDVIGENKYRQTKKQKHKKIRIE